MTSEPTTVPGWVLATNGTLVTQELSPEEKQVGEGEGLLIMYFCLTDIYYFYLPP